MMKKFVLLLTFSFLLPALVSAEMISGVAVLVNDEPITTYDLAKEQAALAKNSGGLTAANKDRLRQVALDSLINKMLIQQKIKELGITVGEEEIRQAIEDVKRSNNLTEETLKAALAARGLSFDDYKAQLREQLERLRIISLEVRSKIQVSEKELREYYAAHEDKFQVDDAFHVRQIFFAIPSNASENERKKIMEKAVTVLGEAKAGGNFAELAKKYSDDPTAEEGGDLGFLKKADLLPEIRDILSKLQPGGVSDLMTTPTGIHIMQLEEHRLGKEQGFETAKKEVEDILYKEKSEERFTQWLNDLRKNASIETVEQKK